MLLFRLEDFTLVTELPERIKDNAEIYFLKCGNRIYSSTASLLGEKKGGIVQVCVRVRGGKGGFGSRLKAEGQRLSNPKRSGNHAECKDVEGRRLKDVRDAQMIQEYLEKEPELKAKAHAERMAYYQNVLSGAVEKPKHSKRQEEYLKSKERTVQNVEAAVADLNSRKLKLEQAMVFFSCLRGRRKSSSNGAAIPHFQITQIPEDGVNALLQRKRRVEVEERTEPPVVVPVAAPVTSNWKPYHNATVAVSSVLKRNNPLPPEDEFYASMQPLRQQSSLEPSQEPSQPLKESSQELLKEESEQKKLIRSPTPDALALFIDDFKSSVAVAETANSSCSSAESLIDLESLPPIPPVDDIELLEESINQVIADPKLNEELDSLQIYSKCDNNSNCNEPETEINAAEVSEDLEIALEGLFLEAPPPVGHLIDSMMDSGDMTPNTLALRLPMRCKTRVTEMATWFEKQMNHPEHYETFQEPQMPLI